MECLNSPEYIAPGVLGPSSPDNSADPLSTGKSKLYASTCANRLYHNDGNRTLMALVSGLTPRRALDCGCGAGGNAKLLAAAGWDVVGVTLSEQESSVAKKFCRDVFVCDLELGLPPAIGGDFDLVILSHVLEHLSRPQKLLEEIGLALSSRGLIAVALPNVLNWRTRTQFLLGKFEYQESGIMDSTHLRFFTYSSARELLHLAGYHIVSSSVEGSVPLKLLRNLLPSLASVIDKRACRYFPGLFGHQLLYLASKGTH